LDSFPECAEIVWWELISARFQSAREQASPVLIGDAKHSETWITFGGARFYAASS
jgi:hypothetical protein